MFYTLHLFIHDEEFTLVNGLTFLLSVAESTQADESVIYDWRGREVYRAVVITAPIVAQTI